MTGRTGAAVVYNPWIKEAKALAEALGRRLEGTGPVWLASLEEFEQRRGEAREFGVVVSVGGDGTILGIVRATMRNGVPLVGVNLGRVGYMTELSPAEALQRIGEYVGSEAWVEERAMLDVWVRRQDGESSGTSGRDPVHGLNEAVVGRAGVSRPLWVDVEVDGAPLVAYAADAVMVATATGSTGYSLSSGGPILYPESTSLLLKPVSPQLSLDTGLVLAPNALVTLTPRDTDSAVLTVDGVDEMVLHPGDAVDVRRSSFVARFLRTGPPRHLSPGLRQRLGSPPRSRERSTDTQAEEA